MERQFFVNSLLSISLAADTEESLGHAEIINFIHLACNLICNTFDAFHNTQISLNKLVLACGIECLHLLNHRISPLTTPTDKDNVWSILILGSIFCESCCNTRTNTCGLALTLGWRNHLCRLQRRQRDGRQVSTPDY